MTFDIDANFAGIEELEAALKLIPGGFEKATMRALNKTIVSARADAVKMLRKDYNLKAGLIRKTLWVKKATPGNLEARFGGSQKRAIGLIHFRAGGRRVPSTHRLKGGGYTPKGGVSVNTLRSRGKTVVKGAFVARMPSGHVGMFIRLGRAETRMAKYKPSRAGSMPGWVGGLRQRRGGRSSRIKELWGPGPISLLSGSDYYEDEISNGLLDRWDKNIQHEAEFVLKKAGLMA